MDKNECVASGCDNPAPPRELCWECYQIQRDDCLLDAELDRYYDEDLEEE